MSFEILDSERPFLELIGLVAEELGFPAYLVGGYVRDRILGRPTKDMDVVCIGDGIRLAEAVAKRLPHKPPVAVFSRFGTAMFRNEDMDIEFVGARKESYNSDSRKPAVLPGSLEDDQNRRDFTINALAISLNKANFGQLVDPFDGVGDLARKLIRTPLDPDITYSDDPLRMMRAIRFATQLGYTIHPESLEAISRNSERLKIISQERISVELEKILLSPTPSIGLRLLFETGLLPIFLPELAAMHGVETEEGKGHKDNFYHTLQVVDNIAPMTDNLWLRWAALMHDIGKPRTKKFEKDTGWSFHGHEAVGERMVGKIFPRMRLPQDHKMKYVQKLVRLHQRPIALTKEEITDSAVRRILFEAGEDIDDLLTLCTADITSRNPYRVQKYLANYEKLKLRITEVEEKDRLRCWQPPISGELIMETFGIGPSKEVGLIKTAIREAILDGIISNDYEAAHAFMLEQGKALGLHLA